MILEAGDLSRCVGRSTCLSPPGHPRHLAGAESQLLRLLRALQLAFCVLLLDETKRLPR